MKLKIDMTRRVVAIKYVRNAFGISGLKKAKDIAEEIERDVDVVLPYHWECICSFLKGWYIAQEDLCVKPSENGWNIEFTDLELLQLQLRHTEKLKERILIDIAIEMGVKR